MIDESKSDNFFNLYCICSFAIGQKTGERKELLTLKLHDFIKLK